MQKLHFICGFVFLAVLFQVSGALAADSKYINRDCIIDKNDPFDIGETMHTGAWEGLCMDISTRRPAVILQEDDQKITFANFYHEKAFWIAEMPKSGVDKVIFQISRFDSHFPGMKVAHTQLRLIMKPGISIKLTPQDKTLGLAPTEIGDIEFVDQITAVKLKQDSFEIMKTLFHAYGNFLRVMGTEDRAHEELGNCSPGDKDCIDETYQYLLNLTDAEKDDLLVNGVRVSDRLSDDDIYKILSENCTTVAFALLDQSVQYAKHVGKFRIYLWNLFDPVIGPSLRALKKRHIIEKEIETWNEETGILN